MPSYDYEALDHAGKTARGRLDADSAASAGALLRKQGLLPLKIDESRGAGAHKSARAGRIREQELAWITHQLASLLAAGLPLEAALRIALEQAPRDPVARVLAAVRDDVRAGMSFAQALAAYPRSFPDVYLALVEAGERSGELAAVLQRLAAYLDTRGDLRNKILTALIYPCTVALVAAAVVVFLLANVVPMVVGAFAQAHQELPLLTRLMLAASGFIQQWGLWLALMIAVLLAAWRAYLRNPQAKIAWHARLLRLPVLGSYIQGINVARFAATLAILSASKVPLLLALEAAGRTLQNMRLQDAVWQALRQVREGSSLARALQAQNVFPPLLVHMVASGERTGELAAMLARAAGVLSSDLQRRASTLGALLEPLMILAMGAIVLLIVLAIMLPILQINQFV